jgi:hypothetical protein
MSNKTITVKLTFDTDYYEDPNDYFTELKGILVDDDLDAYDNAIDATISIELVDEPII